jgi:predicted acyltransferase
LASRRTGREAIRVSLLVAGYVALISHTPEPSLPLTARGRFGDTRSRLAAGSGWRKPQAPHSLLVAGLGKGSITARGRFEP